MPKIKSIEDVLIVSFFILVGICMLSWIGYLLLFAMIVGICIFMYFLVVMCFGIFVGVADELVKIKTTKIITNMDASKIDGTTTKIGNTEVYIEGPRNSFWKGLKYLTTGKEEYSAKMRVDGVEVGKVKFSNKGDLKINYNTKFW